MVSFFLSSLLLVNLIATAFAGIYITEPFGGVTCNGGQSCTVAWVDDGNSPKLSEIGSCSVTLYCDGNVFVQYITPSVDVSQTLSLQFTPDPNAGPNSSSCFLWFTSNEKSGYSSWSGRFSLAGMHGQYGSLGPQDTSMILSSLVAHGGTSQFATATTTSTSGTRTGTSTGVSSTTSALTALTLTSTDARGVAHTTTIIPIGTLKGTSTGTGKPTGTATGPRGTGTLSVVGSATRLSHTHATGFLFSILAIFALAP